MNDKKPLIEPGAIERAIAEFDRAMMDPGVRDEMAIAMGVPADLLWPPNPLCPHCGKASSARWEEKIILRGDAAPARAHMPSHVCESCGFRFLSEHDATVRMMVMSVLAQRSGPDEQK